MLACIDLLPCSVIRRLWVNAFYYEELQPAVVDDELGGW